MLHLTKPLTETLTQPSTELNGHKILIVVPFTVRDKLQTEMLSHWEPSLKKM